MAQLGHIKVTVEIVTKPNGRTVHVGPWKVGHACPKCGVPEDWSRWARELLTVCGACGRIGHSSLWPSVAIRWVRTKTGFWPWQTEGHYEKQAIDG